VSLLAKKEASRVLIEPSGRVVEALRLAIVEVGLDELVRRTGSSSELMEKWVNGSEWVPIGVIKEVCEINRNIPDAPSYSKVLSECTSGAQFRITAREEIEKPTAPVGAEAAPPKAETLAKRFEKPSTVARGPEVSRQITKIAVVLFVVPLAGAVIGFLGGGLWGAVIGTVTSYAIGTALAFLLLLPRKTRGT